MALGFRTVCQGCKRLISAPLLYTSDNKPWTRCKNCGAIWWIYVCPTCEAVYEFNGKDNIGAVECCGTRYCEPTYPPMKIGVGWGVLRFLRGITGV